MPTSETAQKTVMASRAHAPAATEATSARTSLTTAWRLRRVRMAQLVSQSLATSSAIAQAAS